MREAAPYFYTLELFWIHRNTWRPHMMRDFVKFWVVWGQMYSEKTPSFFRLSSEITYKKKKKRTNTGSRRWSVKWRNSSIRLPRVPVPAPLLHSPLLLVVCRAGRQTIWEGSRTRHPAFCSRSGDKTAVQRSVNQPSSPQENITYHTSPRYELFLPPVRCQATASL